MMSSGLRDRAAGGRDAEAQAYSLKWAQPPKRPADRAAGSDMTGGVLSSQVELPSRRWYIEAVGESAAE